MPVGLIFFAVPEEAKPFLEHARRQGYPIRGLPLLLPGTRRWAVGPHEVHVSGMGPLRAANAARVALENSNPRWLITAGFAGGLKPAWSIGDVLWEADPLFPIRIPTALPLAHPATFHCAPRVAVTAAQKATLHQSSGADAVEMESGVIRRLCHSRSLPSATIRVISDTASEDLPLDFNELMTADYRMDFGRLTWRLVRSPGRIPALLRFQRQLLVASNRLALALASAVFVPPPDASVPSDPNA